MKAYLFDLDGTLVNSIFSISYFVNQALESCNLKSLETNLYKTFVGDGARTLIKRVLEYQDAYSEQRLETVLQRYNQTYDNNYMYLCEPYKGIEEVVRELKQRGNTVGVLSNKPHSTTVKVVETIFGKDVFRCIYGQREGVELKPHPRALASILEELNIKREDCVYVGDTKVDILTGKNAGVSTIGVLWGFRDRKELEKYGADRIISHPQELLSIEI